MNTVDRFLAKVQKTNECWHWTGAKDWKGYGSFKEATNRTVRAHRFSYEIYVGAIPAGLMLDHLCRNPACVNPAHLEPVTNKENCARGNAVLAKTSIECCKKGHPYDTENTYVDPRGWRNCRICMRESVKEYRKKRRATHVVG